ncbi:hypothetical protein ACVHNB_39215 [Streptomyces sp. YJ-C3]
MNPSSPTRLLARPLVRLTSAALAASTALQFWTQGTTEPTPSPRPEQTHGKRSGS